MQVKITTETLCCWCYNEMGGTHDQPRKKIAGDERNTQTMQ